MFGGVFLFGVGKIKLSFMECIHHLQVQYVEDVALINLFFFFFFKTGIVQLSNLTSRWTTREYVRN